MSLSSFDAEYELVVALKKAKILNFCPSNAVVRNSFQWIR